MIFQFKWIWRQDVHKWSMPNICLRRLNYKLSSQQESQININVQKKKKNKINEIYFLILIKCPNVYCTSCKLQSVFIIYIHSYLYVALRSYQSCRSFFYVFCLLFNATKYFTNINLIFSILLPKPTAVL